MVITQHNVGVAYITGMGVSKNTDTAVYWLEKSAAQGDPIAKIYAKNIQKGLPATGARPALLMDDSESSKSQVRIGVNPQAVSEKEKQLARLVEDYSHNHQYMEGGVYECVDMASDVWNICVSKQFNAKIMVGNVDKEISSMKEANHAWVLAETVPGHWTALECTTGKVVNEQENPRYFKGKTFLDAGQLKEYQLLLKKYSDAASKGKEAQQDYERVYSQFERANYCGKLALKAELIYLQAILNSRNSDFNEVERQMLAILAD